MINLIYGGKGSGKTTAIIAGANQNVANAKGFHIYIDKNNARMHDLEHQVKLVDAGEYAIDDETKFIAFVKGMVAVNYDIEKIYIDNLEKITGLAIADAEGLYKGLEQISKQSGVEFVATVAAEKEELPDFLRKYL